MQINRERLAASFIALCSIESPSRREGCLSRYLQGVFGKLQADAILIDDSAQETGSDTGNMVVRFNGSAGTPLFFACHMDTVGPTAGVRVVREKDTFKSGGATVLGADDKSGIAAVIELVTLLREQGLEHRPLELIFTTCEEIGLLGAKAFDPGVLTAGYGFALDSTKIGAVITGAPAANRLKITVKGRAAHSGLAPEDGINALALAADALSRLPLGRITEITTANFGLISGGTATNIVPETVVLEGEVRSHSQEELSNATERIQRVFRGVAEHWPLPEGSGPPRVEMEVFLDFPLMSLGEDSFPVAHLRRAEKKLGRTLVADMAGSGSDANIFCGYGLPTVILPTGMSRVHSTEEEADLEEMVRLTELLLALAGSV